jgi:ferredoxin-NADP reductase
MHVLSFLDKIHEGATVYTFRFKKPKNLRHKAGQHSLFVLPGFYRPHPFTISSAPDEPYVTFSTKIREGSRFKQHLMRLTKSDKVIMFGPILNFTLETPQTNRVFLAQSIGVTPFRSMLVHINRHKLPTKTSLIHVDAESHPFKEITAEYADSAHYPTTSDEFRALLAKQDTQQLFYLSGSPRFVRETKSELRQLGIPKKNIKTDSFLGY